MDNELRIVQGNTFATAIEIHAVDATGQPIVDWSLQDSTDIRVWYVFAGREQEIATWQIDDGKLVILWLANMQRVGTYDIFCAGKYNGADWRNAMQYQFRIVRFNHEANIPANVVILDGIYQLSAELQIITQFQGGGGGGTPSQTLPLMDGVAQVGTENAYARGDHRHPSDTSKQDFIADLATIRSGAAAGATAYQKPTNGIPSTDMAQAVQTSLGKADTAYQKPTNGIPSTDLASGVIPDVSQFITNSVNDLVNYYTKSQTYTQSEVDSLIAGISGFEYEVVATLPTASASTMHKIYLTPSSDPQTQNIKDEYITLESSGSYSWEQIGSTAIDLSGYVTTTDLNTALADYTTSADLATLLAGYQTKIDSTHKLDYSLLSNTPDIPPVVDSLSSASTTAALSANQGKVLNDGKQDKIDATHKLSADLVDDTSTTNKFVTAAEKTTWNGKQDALVSGTNIKTVNGNSVLGSGNLSTRMPLVSHGTNDTTYTLPTNEYHTWGIVSTLTISLGTAESGVVNEYWFKFESGSTATNLVLPASVVFPKGNALAVAANCIYEVHIVENRAEWNEWEVQS